MAQEECPEKVVKKAKLTEDPTDNDTPSAPPTPAAPAVPNGEQKASVFGMFSTDYDKFRPGYPQLGIAASVDIATRARKLTNASSDKTFNVVDLACGTGKASVLYAREETVSNVICVDHDERMLEECKRVASSQSLNLTVQLGTAEETGLESECADLVGVHTAFHWFDAEKALVELHRILKPNGIGINHYYC